MLARIFTRLFYAAVFFALGVWAAPSMNDLGGLVDRGVAAGSHAFDGLWGWAESTISGQAPTVAPAPAPKPVAAAPAPAPAPAPAAKPAAPAPAPAPAAKSAAPAPAAAVAGDTVEAARTANARGDIFAAVRIYEGLIARTPDDAALRGELGNVYWSAGRLQQAAEAYHGAALKLLAARRIDDARALEVPVRKGDPALADDLAKRLAEAARAK